VPYFAVRAEYDDTRAREALGPKLRPQPLGRYYGRIIDYALQTGWGTRPVTRAEAIARVAPAAASKSRALAGVEG
jgi:hypothetical protein